MLALVSPARAQTTLNGNHTITGSLGVGGSADVMGDLTLSGSNFWIFQTPNDGRTDMFIAPAQDWTKETKFKSNGDVIFSGRVGIGRITDSSPTYLGTLRLAVEGNLGAHAVYVRAPGVAWPDYVFGPGYQLRPLPELEQYVRTHRHLPDVPAATEVQQQGLDLASTDAVLLRKVEELTLYLIALQKENDALKARVSALEQKP